MCHYLFSLPVVGLLSFVLFPQPQATAIYLALVLVFATGLVLTVRSQRKPVAAGLDGLPGGTGEIIAVQERWRHGNYLVRYKGESWSAIADTQLAMGQKVTVKSLKGNRLVVEPVNSPPAP